MHMNDDVFAYQLESFHLLPDKPQGLLSFCEISNLTVFFVVLMYLPRESCPEAFLLWERNCPGG